MKMSRDARNITNALIEKQGAGATIAPADVYFAEMMAYSFYGKTVVGHINRMYNPNSKGNPNEIAFYLKPTFSLNKGRRNKEEWRMMPDHQENYYAISKYLIEDYSYDFLKIVKDICGYPPQMVKEGIQISKAENVHSIPYLLRVVEGIKARQEFKVVKMDQFRQKFHNQEEAATIKRSAVEMASLMAGWEESIQNMKLQQKVKDLYGEEQK